MRTGRSPGWRGALQGAGARFAALSAVALAALAVALAAPGAPARAQDGGAEGTPAGIHDVPAGPGTIRGRIVHGSTGEPVPGAEVVLYALRSDGAPGVRRTVSDRRGEYTFENVSNDPAMSYLIGARHAGIPYPGARVQFEPGESERRADVQVSEATRDPAGVRVAEVRLQIDRIAGRPAVREIYRLENPGDATVYVPEGQREDARPALRATLPEGARGFGSDFPMEGLVRDGSEIAFFGPVYPGGQELSFRYALPAVEGEVEVEKTFPRGAAQVTVLSPESGPELIAKGLEPGEPVTLQDRAYASLEAGRVAPGGRVRFALALPPAQHDASALEPVEVRAFLELDAAALRVREEHIFDVSGDRPLVAAGEDPLLFLSVPPNAAELRFSEDSFGMGLALSPEGGFELRGPLSPGESAVAVAYKIPVSGPDAEAGVTWQRRFSVELPVLSVFIADTGVVVETDRLHRRRPVRTPDRIYIAEEGFRIEPSETVSVRLSSLSQRAEVAGNGAKLLVLVAGAGAIAFLFAPVGRARREAAQVAAGPAVSLRTEREALYASMRDLDHDFEVGKIDSADYPSLRDSLRARAVALLRAEREAESRAATDAATGRAQAPGQPSETAPRSAAAGEGLPSGAAGSADAACPACAAPTRAADRFCAQCGARLAARSGAGT